MRGSQPVRAPKRRRIDPRFLRSDGKPNFSNRVYERGSELDYIVRKVVERPTPTEPIGMVIKYMSLPYGRRLPICRATGEIEGVVTSSDVVSYFGGGDYYNIVINRHEDNLYSALEEPVSTIMSREVVYSEISETVVDVLEKMIVHGVGIVPVVDKEMRLIGVVTERDIIEHLVDKHVGIRVAEVMSRAVISVSIESSIGQAARNMIRYGYRRLPVVDGDSVVGVVSTLDIIEFYASNRAFHYAPSGRMSETLKAPVKEIYNPKIVAIEPHLDVGDGATIMMRENVDHVIVASDNRMLGILTERDVLLALSLRR